MILKPWNRFCAALFLVCLTVFTSGCNSVLIEGLKFTSEPNLETANLKLVFSKAVRSDLGGTFPIENYGSVFVNPWSPSDPFSVGFRMNLDVFNDQDLLNLEPVTTLPSGQPIPIPVSNRAFARVSLQKNPSKKFDVYAYVDVLNQEWIGVVVTLKFVDAKNFPTGITVSQQFLRDKKGVARGVGAFFGPSVTSSGKLKTPGGIALFANVRSLMGATAKRKAPLAVYVKPHEGYFFNGPLAPYYRAEPRQAAKLGEAFQTLMNLN